MVRPGLRAGNVKKKMIRTPSGDLKVRILKEKHSKAKCGVCGAFLGGVPTDPSVLRKSSKTEKRPERAYGGVLCHNCLSKQIKERIYE